MTSPLQAPRRILLTGGAGFIGSHLCERLIAAGNQVTVFDDFNDYYDPQLKRRNLAAVASSISLVEADIRDAVAVERCFTKGAFDTVIHLAARAGVRPSILNPKLYMTTNIEGTFNLLDACVHHGVGNFVFSSSSSVYGVNELSPFSEKDPILRTISPYAATKLASEQICSNYSHLFGIRMRCLRFFTVYGPRQRPDLAIARFARAILDGKPITRFGSGESRRDYTFVDDIIEGVVRSIGDASGDFRIINLGGHATTSLNELIALLERVIGREAVIEDAPEQPGDVPATFADVTEARVCLGWEPQVALVEGLERYVAWLKQQDSDAVGNTEKKS